MKVRRDSWHVKVGQWVTDVGWVGRWLMKQTPSKKQTIYEPKNLCPHFWTIVLGTPFMLVLNIEAAILITAVALCIKIIEPIVRAVLWTSPRVVSVVKRTPCPKQNPTPEWLQVLYHKACPLIELTD